MSTPTRLIALAAAAAACDLFTRCHWPWLVLGWVALVPWLAVLDAAGTLRAALAAGVAMAVAYELVVFGWFAGSMATYAGTSWPIGLAVLVLLAPLLQPQFLTVAAARHLARRRGAGVARLALTSATVWIATEWLVGKLFDDTLGYALYPSAWLRQAADLGGVLGLTAVLVAANECGFAVLRAMGRAESLSRGLRAAAGPALTVAGLITALIGYGMLRLHTLAGLPTGEPIRAAVVQPDVSQYDRLRAHLGTFEAVRAILDAHFTLSAEALERGRPQLLVWPETAYPTTFGVPKSPEGADFDREIAGFVARAGVPLVFGSYDAENGAEFNAAVFLEPLRRGSRAGSLTFDAYRKASLFPLTERVPQLLDGPRLRRWLPWLGTWTPGSGGTVLVLNLPDGRPVHIAPLICYDVLEPSHARNAVRGGAELLLTLSNDSWLTGPGPWLHLVGAAFRSVETRRPQLRATNTGISAVISETGDLEQTASIHERTALQATVSPRQIPQTLVVRWGNWLAYLATATAAVLLVALALGA